jgi:peptidoglycan hydrolase-like protein with peptidoglycan-binding domain
VTYTQASTGVGSVGGGSGGGGVSSSSSIGVTPSVTSTTPSIATTAPVGQVLGAQSFHFTLPLKMGIHSDEVLQLQTRLNADGAKLALDSKFGPKTKAALVAWQKAHSLTADGVVGPKTRTALNA